MLKRIASDHDRRLGRLTVEDAPTLQSTRVVRIRKIQRLNVNLVF